MDIKQVYILAGTRLYSSVVLVELFETFFFFRRVVLTECLSQSSLFFLMISMLTTLSVEAYVCVFYCDKLIGSPHVTSILASGTVNKDDTQR